MTNKIAVGLSLSIMLLAWVLQSRAQDTVSFRVIKNVAILEGKINDNTAFFIVDTGATITLLNESLAKHFNFYVVDNKYFSKRSVLGLGGRSVIKEARSATIKVGPHEIKFITKAADLDNLTAYFFDTNLKIAGIIGTDLLYMLNGSIDFRNNTIILCCCRGFK